MNCKICEKPENDYDFILKECKQAELCIFCLNGLVHLKELVKHESGRAIVMQMAIEAQTKHNIE